MVFSNPASKTTWHSIYNKNNNKRFISFIDSNWSFLVFVTHCKPFMFEVCRCQLSRQLSPDIPIKSTQSRGNRTLKVVRVKGQDNRFVWAQQGDPADNHLNLRVSREGKNRRSLSPSLQYDREETIQIQLESLRNNNDPYPDHGLEVLYRFAGIDPWSRSNYFGRSLDLGQFERFRRIMNTECFSLLVNHTSAEMLSSMEISEHVWKARFCVGNHYRKEERIFEFTMCRELGGRYDGVWFTRQLICDDDSQGRKIYAVI